jgi:hypothetical protein
MTSQLPQVSLGSSTPSATYYTAYHGIATDPSGKFTNFIVRLDDSHREYGYWRFTSLEDEYCANVNGFHTPEAILVAVDRGDGTYEDISISWVPGRVDMNMKLTMSGCAAQHLKEIYSMRQFLRKPMSSRNRVPIYPVDPRLKDYLNARNRASMTPAHGSANLATIDPRISVTQSASLPSPIVDSRAPLQSEPYSSPLLQDNQVNLTASSEKSTALRSEPRSCPDSPRRTPCTSPTTSKNPAPLRPLPTAPSPALLSPHPVAQGFKKSSSFNSKNQIDQACSITNAHTSQPYNGACTPQAYQSSNKSQDQANLTQNLQMPQQQPKPRILKASPVQFRSPIGAKPTHSSKSSRKPLQLPRHDVSQQSVPAGKSSQASRCADSPCLSAHGTLPMHSAISPHSSHRDRISPYPPLENKVLESRPTSSHMTLYSRPKNPEQNAEAYGGAQPLVFNKITAGSQQLHKATNPSDNDSIELPSNQNSKPVNFAGQIKRPNTARREGLSDMSGVKTANNAAGDQSKLLQIKTLTSQLNQLKDSNVKSPKRPVAADQKGTRQTKKLKDNIHDGTLISSLQQTPSPPTITDMYYGLPCMDCGQYIGHKWDCYIGSMLVQASTALMSNID